MSYGAFPDGSYDHVKMGRHNQRETSTALEIARNQHRSSLVARVCGARYREPLQRILRQLFQNPLGFAGAAHLFADVVGRCAGSEIAIAAAKAESATKLVRKSVLESRNLILCSLKSER